MLTCNEAGKARVLLITLTMSLFHSYPSIYMTVWSWMYSTRTLKLKQLNGIQLLWIFVVVVVVVVVVFVLGCGFCGGFCNLNQTTAECHNVFCGKHLYCVFLYYVGYSTLCAVCDLILANLWISWHKSVTCLFVADPGLINNLKIWVTPPKTPGFGAQ